MVYVVTFHLTQPKPCYEKFFACFEDPVYFQYAEEITASCYLIDSVCTAVKLRDMLVENLDPGDKLLVAELILGACCGKLGERTKRNLKQLVFRKTEDLFR